MISKYKISHIYWKIQSLDAPKERKVGVMRNRNKEMPLYGARLFNSRHYAQVCQFFQLILSKNFIWRMHLFLQKLFHKKKTFKFKTKLKKKL